MRALIPRELRGWHTERKSEQEVSGRPESYIAREDFRPRERKEESRQKKD